MLDALFFISPVSKPFLKCLSAFLDDLFIVLDPITAPYFLLHYQSFKMGFGVIFSRYQLRNLRLMIDPNLRCEIRVTDVQMRNFNNKVLLKFFSLTRKKTLLNCAIRIIIIIIISIQLRSRIFS